MDLDHSSDLLYKRWSKEGLEGWMEKRRGQRRGGKRGKNRNGNI